MNLQKDIIRITAEYFEDKIDFYKLSNSSKEFKSVLNKICSQELNIEEGRNDIEYENGKALGTYWAALCLDDLIRTRQFIRGIDKAIKEKKNKKPIHILYAGTGPFATLILPIIFRYPKEAIKYTLLEVNPFTYQILQNVISKLGLESYDITMLKNDASKHQIDPLNKPDIIISETMQNALAKEQQVPIFLNLMEQAKRDTIFIPKKIELHIGLKKEGIPTEELQPKHYHKIEKVFEVSKESMFPSNKSENQGPNKTSFEKRETKIRNENLKGFDQLVIITEIEVFNDEKININESGLTTPLIINDIPNNFKESLTIYTQYLISSEPKLNYEIVINN